MKKHISIIVIIVATIIFVFIEKSAQNFLIYMISITVVLPLMFEENLDKKTNYIVSGQERSGTSMLMQILQAGDIPIAFDNSRPADDHNKKGYYELEGGKIINKLENEEFPFPKYRGKFIKITAYGLKFLPVGKYKIIYTERNYEEVLDSMEKMIKDFDRQSAEDNINKLAYHMKTDVLSREDFDVLFVNYNEILKHPKENIKKILSFLDLSEQNLSQMVDSIDPKMYHNKRS